MDTVKPMVNADTADQLTNDNTPTLTGTISMIEVRVDRLRIIIGGRIFDSGDGFLTISGGTDWTRIWTV